MRDSVRVSVSGASAFGTALSCSVLGLLLLSACGTPPRVAEVPRPRPLGPLVSLVPEGATLVVVARPAVLIGDSATRRVVDAILPAEQLDRFAVRTGIDPRVLTELVVADHPEGRVVVASGPIDAELAVREAGERMAPLESSVDEPFPRRAGFLGERRVDLAALRPRVVLWVEGTPQLAAAVLASVRRPPPARAHPLGGRAGTELREAVEGAPFALFAPRPLGLPLDSGVGMLFARERALVAAVDRVEEGSLAVMADVRGEFPPRAEDNFRALAASLADSDLGSALGVRDALPSLRIQVEDERVVLRARLDPALLAAGLRALFVAEIRELLGDGPEGPGQTAGESLGEAHNASE